MKSTISQDRDALMGFATIIIFLGHTIFYSHGTIYYGPILNEIVTMGFIGVDIFLVLSSFGLCKSFENNTSIVFYKHRLLRIIPAVFSIALLSILIRKPSFHEIINPLYWYNNYWFIGFIVVMYILFPIVYKFIKYTKPLYSHLLVLSISVSLFCPYLVAHQGVSCNPFVCAITRFPIFCLGIFIWREKADYLNNKWVLSGMFVFGVVSLIPFYIVNDLGGNIYITDYYNLLFLTPPILKIFNIVGRDNLIYDVFRKLSTYSLEIYLVQVTIMPQVVQVLLDYEFNSFFIVCISFGVVFTIAYCINSICCLFKRRLF